jgi:hypothetical protein
LANSKRQAFLSNDFWKKLEKLISKMKDGKHLQLIFRNNAPNENS